MIDLDLKYEERVNFEKCLTENYLMKHGMDYFGKRDLIYIDMFGRNDVRNILNPSLQAEWSNSDHKRESFNVIEIRYMQPI